MTSLLKLFLTLYYIKQIDFKLPCVCSVIDRFLFLPHFDVLCDLLLNRRTATWNLFVKYLVCQAHGYLSLYYNKKTMHWVLKYRVVPLHHSASSAKRFPLAKFCDIHRKTTPRLYKHMAFPSNCSNSFFKRFPFQAIAPYK